MSTNKDLLKQAIAEAKTIREAAIANAKEALEESLTPHLKEMLALKLQEMEEEDNMEENINEEDMINDPEGPTAKGNVHEAEEDEDEVEETEEGEETEEEDEDIEIKDMSVEELKDLIRDIVAQETGEEGSEEEMPGEEAPEGDDMMGMDSEEEIDINELLAELAQEEEMEEGLKDTFKKAGEKIKGAVGPGGKMEKWIDRTGDKMKKAGIASPYGANHSVFEESENLEEGFEDWLDSVSAKLEKFGKNNPAIQAIEKAVTSAQEKAKKAGLTGHGMTKGHRISEESEELEEALATVQQLRTQLQEVNLLNAKLLYVNKVFKSNNLSENQKVNVIAAFDKAETVKEVKLVFETVSKNVVAKPVQIREHKSFASKPAGTAATTGKKEVISEVSETVKRMQKLAGII